MQLTNTDRKVLFSFSFGEITCYLIKNEIINCATKTLLSKNNIVKHKSSANFTSKT